MKDYVLSCCSTSDLEKSVYEKNGIEVIPFHVIIDGKDYLDDLGESIPIDEFYKKLEEGADARTSQVTVNEYEKHFEKHLKEGKDIIHICFSSGLSGAYNSALMCQKKLEEKYPDRKIYIIDSLCASSGYGLLMTKLAKEKKKGKTIDELAKFAEAIKLTVNHYFFSSDLKFYVKGGRISKTSGFLGNLLRICPVLDVNYEGKLIPREKVFTTKLAQLQLVKKMEQNCENGENYDDDVYISNSACLPLAQGVKKFILNKFKKLTDEKVKIYSIGTTIGSHTGPGTVALFFFGKKREKNNE